MTYVSGILPTMAWKCHVLVVKEFPSFGRGRQGVWADDILGHMRCLGEISE